LIKQSVNHWSITKFVIALTRSIAWPEENKKKRREKCAFSAPTQFVCSDTGL